MTYLRGHWQIFAILAVVFALWATPVVLPLKLLVVFFHELSHALVAILTGGRVESFSVDFRQGGEVWTRGGSRFLTLSAGYLGSLAIGVGLLFAALKLHRDRAILTVLGGVMWAVLLLYVRDIPAALICGLTGAALIAAGRVLSEPVCDLILRVIGLTSVLYVPYDIYDDTIRRSELRSDARMLAEEFFGTTMMWGGLWLVIALGVVYWCLRYGLGAGSNLTLPGRR